MIVVNVLMKFDFLHLYEAFVLFWKMKNRNLFIELNIPEEKDFKETLINSWTKPIPMEYHILHSPALNQQLAYLAPKENRQSCFQQGEKSLKSSGDKRKNKQRLRYSKLQEELRFLQQFLKDFKGLHESQLLLYKQTLLVRYLKGFSDELKTECHEKSHFIRSIWNALIKIFQQLFQRVVAESKKKESSLLSEEILMHREYQNKLGELIKANKILVQSEGKYKGAINQLMDSIAATNVKLKGTKSLQQKSAITVKQLSQKYEQLKADYLDIVVFTGISREEAQLRLHDRQVLLFSKQISDNNAEVKLHAKASRKARVITEKIDIDLILEEIEAEEEYSFEIECDQKKEVKYSNQKTQTEPFVFADTSDALVQVSYSDLVQNSIIKDNGVQTGKQQLVFKFNAKTQTQQKILLDRKQFKLEKVMSWNFYPEKENNNESAQLIFKLFQPQNDSIFFQPAFVSTTQGIKQTQASEGFTSLHGNESMESIADKGKKVRKSRQSKMFRVGDVSKVLKNFPQSRFKTEGGRQSLSISFGQKRNSESKKMSELILLQEIKKKILGKWMKYNCQEKANDFFQQIKEEMKLKNRNILSSLAQAQAEIFSRTNSFIQNVQLSQTNEELMNRQHAIVNKKAYTTSKCLRIVADIFRTYAYFIKEGIYSLSMVSLAMDYLGALKGQILEQDIKEKLFIQFLRCCHSCVDNHFLIKNFFLLCGFPYGKQRASKMTLKINETLKPEDKYLKYMFSSEVYTYFKLLEILNCQQGTDFLQAYTTFEVVLNSLDKMKLLYKNCEGLISDIKGLVTKTIESSGQSHPKIDVFKALQFIIQKILEYKQKIALKLEPFKLFYGQLDHQFFIQFLSLATQDPKQMLTSLRIFRLSYVSSSVLENIASLLLIEGFETNLAPFLEVQKNYKHQIVKKLLAKKNIESRLINSMVRALSNKQLARVQFLYLLRMLWVQQSERISESFLGNDLSAIYSVGATHTMTKPEKGNFHSVIFGT